MKTVAAYRVKNEARWIAHSLERTLEVAESVILFDDHSTDGTPDIARSFKRVHVIDSPYDGHDEARDKNLLLDRLVIAGAEWVLFLDGDEVLTKKAVAEVRGICKTRISGVFSFRMAYLWDRPDQERVDALYANFHAPRLFSMFDQNKYGLIYRSTKHGGNLHCGQIPANLKVRHHRSASPIKHYGYMEEADRVRKHQWYNSIDTEVGRVREGNYDHVIGKPNHIAPGPVMLRTFFDE